MHSKCFLAKETFFKSRKTIQLCYSERTRKGKGIQKYQTHQTSPIILFTPLILITELGKKLGMTFQLLNRHKNCSNYLTPYEISSGLRTHDACFERNSSGRTGGDSCQWEHRLHRPVRTMSENSTTRLQLEPLKSPKLGDRLPLRRPCENSATHVARTWRNKYFRL